ncbi:MAG: MarR family transcriptional regulator [Nanoarchaeota archaeon]|nr:MarR family transcriptional regulator [Nanoarchaeota archaeon]MBU1974785.1 MarR family transcriptional regulator [Nanoarchaeota archaeon]
MNQKQIGIILIVIGIALTIFVFMAKEKEDKIIRQMVMDKGSCFLDDGTCLHDDRDYSMYIFGWVISVSLLLFGIYLTFFDKTQQVLAEHQVKVSSALREAKKHETKNGRFNAFLSGFSEEEQTILKAIKEQEGIKQSTLRFRTGMSKTKLSLLLKSLEERNIISRKPAGKTNEVFLRKKY